MKIEKKLYSVENFSIIEIVRGYARPQDAHVRHCVQTHIECIYRVGSCVCPKDLSVKFIIILTWAVG